MLNLTSETPSSKDFFESKLRDKFDKYDQMFEQPKEKLIELKRKQKMEPNNFSSEHIENYVLTITSETTYYEDCFETKIHSN